MKRRNREGIVDLTGTTVAGPAATQNATYVDLLAELERSGAAYEARSHGGVLKLSSDGGRVVYVERWREPVAEHARWLVFADGAGRESTRQVQCSSLEATVAFVRDELARPCNLGLAS